MVDRLPSTRLLSLRLGAAVVALWIGLPGAATPQAPGQHLITDAADRELPWQVTEVFRLGDGKTSDVTFFCVFPWSVAVDSNRRVYVLDSGDAAVSVFDSTGQLLRRVGRSGGGPGEFRRPVSLAVTASGEILVADQAKRALVRFDADGEVLDQIRVPNVAAPLAKVAAIGESLVLSFGYLTDERVLVRYAPVSATLDTIVTLTADAGVPMVACGVAAGSFRPVFAPTLRWTVGQDRIVTDTGVAYEVAVRGATVQTLKVGRTIDAIPVTRRMALESNGVRNGFRITVEGRTCGITPEEVVDIRGHAPHRSRVLSVKLSSQNDLWVARLEGDGESSRIDVFDSEGAYLGTLPPDTPFPGAFGPRGFFVTLSHSPEGVPVVVGYQVHR